MSEGRPEESERHGIADVSDEELPDDVRPSEDNPLAQPVDDDVPNDVVGDVEQRGAEESTDGGTDDPGEGADAIA
jgi:hypothetical protein